MNRNTIQSTRATVGLKGNKILDNFYWFPIISTVVHIFYIISSDRQTIYNNPNSSSLLIQKFIMAI